VGIERHRSSYFLHFGLLTSHFSLVGLLLYLLAAESLPRRYILLVPISLISPALFAYSYGGRSPVIAALLLCVAAFLVRAMMGRPAIPRAKVVSAILAVAVLAAALYNSFIFSERRAISSSPPVWLAQARLANSISNAMGSSSRAFARDCSACTTSPTIA
jgi:hypothetical protein